MDLFPSCYRQTRVHISKQNHGVTRQHVTCMVSLMTCYSDIYSTVISRILICLRIKLCIVFGQGCSSNCMHIGSLKIYPGAKRLAYGTLFIYKGNFGQKDQDYIHF